MRVCALLNWCGIKSAIVGMFSHAAGATPLHLGAMCGHASVCALLLESRCDAHAKDFRGKTAEDLGVSFSLGTKLSQSRSTPQLRNIVQLVHDGVMDLDGSLSRQVSPSSFRIKL